MQDEFQFILSAGPLNRLYTNICTYAYIQNCCNALARRRAPQTDRQTYSQSDRETRRLRVRNNRIGYGLGLVQFFFPLLSAVPLKCACSCKQIFRSSNSANNCNERRRSRSRRRSAQRATSSVSAAAGELSLNLLTNQYQCQYTRTPAHTVCMCMYVYTHTQTHAFRRLRLCGNGTQIMAIKIN